MPKYRLGGFFFDISSILSGLWLWAVSNFVTFCPDWPPAVGPKIHIFCPDRDQGFPAIARGPHSPHKHSAPSSRSTQSHERHAPFSPSVTPSEILHIFNLTNRVNLVIWEVLGKFSIAGLSEKYKTCSPVSWYLTESMTASRRPCNGFGYLAFCSQIPCQCQACLQPIRKYR